MLRSSGISCFKQGAHLLTESTDSVEHAKRPVSADIDATCLVQGEHITIRGNTHYSVKSFDMKFSVGNAQLYLGDLFNGDNELGELQPSTEVWFSRAPSRSVHRN
jgi:hypothetical protein